MFVITPLTCGKGKACVFAKIVFIRSVVFVQVSRVRGEPLATWNLRKIPYNLKTKKAKQSLKPYHSVFFASRRVFSYPFLLW